MPSDLRERIVGLVDTAAPPIDVESLGRQLAARDEREAASRVPSAAPLRRRIWAFAAAFGGALVLVGGALAAGVWLHESEAPDPGGFADSPAATSVGTSGWWWIALTLVVLGLGAVALVASRRRTLRPGEEDAMQTLEKRTEPSSQPKVEKLTRQRRWLVVALALVLVVGAVAIGWLIAENRSLESDLDAAEAAVLDAQRAAEAQSQATVWPAESELTVRQQSMVEATERFWSAWNDEDFDTMMSIYALGARHGAFYEGGFSKVDSEHRSGMEGWRTLLGEYEIVQTTLVGSSVIQVVETGFGQLDAYTFRFSAGDNPRILVSYHDASTAVRG